jgi:superfamily II DNA or RNA helicase
MESPVKLRIDKSELTALQISQLKTGLTYTDQKAVFELNRFKKNGPRWYSPDVYQEKLDELKSKTKVCLLFEEEDCYWTWSGMAEYVSSKLNQHIKYAFSYPKPKLVPWDVVPPFKMHGYQSQALEKLLAEKHGGIEFATGLGKTFILENIIKELGLKTVVMAPSASIAGQIFKSFTEHFGSKNVGQFYGGKKVCKKLITVGTAQSLTLVEKDSPVWDELQKVEVFIADESHQCPASTLAKVCFSLLARVPYRFFFSATQMRNDGLDLLLTGITGRIVMKMSLREGVDQKYLAKPKFHMIHMPPNGSFKFDDANEATRHHLYYNPSVIKKVAELVNMSVTAGMPTLVLIEEVEQFTKLLPFLKHAPGFAHGPLNEDNRKKVPEPFWDSSPDDLVSDFNAGRLNLLVGTSCISTGTDIRPIKFLVYWQGGKSEIQVKQAIGRGTRLSPGKTDFHLIDFCVDPPQDNPKYWTVESHALQRQLIYEDLYGPVNVEI